MPGKSDMNGGQADAYGKVHGNTKMPCGRWRYCGSASCKHAVVCAELNAIVMEARATEKMYRDAGLNAKTLPALPGQAVERKPLAQPADVVYIYDGSLEGLLCCVHQSVYSKQLPCAVWPEHAMQPSLFEQQLIETDPEKAVRVRASIPQKISARMLDLVETVFLSCMEEKELALLRLLLLGYQKGPQVLLMLGHPDVAPVLRAEGHLGREAHLLKGFIRFSDYDGVLGATITPKNFVLPYLAEHFVGRYSNEDFLIYDKTHKAAMIYENRQCRIVPLEGIEFPAANEKELQYRALWKRFYNTIAIEARTNPRCRMTLMPKRYWENMLEVQDLL